MIDSKNISENKSAPEYEEHIDIQIRLKNRLVHKILHFHCQLWNVVESKSRMVIDVERYCPDANYGSETRKCWKFSVPSRHANDKPDSSNGRQEIIVWRRLKQSIVVVHKIKAFKYSLEQWILCILGWSGFFRLTVIIGIDIGLSVFNLSADFVINWYTRRYYGKYEYETVTKIR